MYAWIEVCLDGCVDGWKIGMMDACFHGWMDGRKEGNVLFNDALNTFLFTVIWRRTYGKGPLFINAI